MSSGVKDDTGKLRWDLLPWSPVVEVIRVLEFGAVKYGDWNWSTVEHPRRRYFSACLRHLVAWWTGEPHDPESKLHHLAHAVCCILFLMWTDQHFQSSTKK